MSYDSQTSTALINKLRKDVDNLKLRVATIYDQKPLGTAGGASVATTWTTREINTIHDDPYDLVVNGDLTGNTFTVDPGTYQIDVLSSYHSSYKTRTRLYDVTNAAVVGYSISTYVFNQTLVNLYQSERITPHKRTTYRIEYYTEQAKPDGLGIATSLGNYEIYTILNIVALDVAPAS